MKPTKEPREKKMKCNHNPSHQGPIGYVDWMCWAGNRVKNGWKQKRCPKCELYVRWVKP